MNYFDLQIIVWVLLAVVLVGYMGYTQLVRIQYVSPAKLWQLPLLLAIWNVYTLTSVIDPVAIVLAIAACGAGMALGLVRGLINRVSFDPTSNRLIVFGSLAGMLVWLGGVIVSVALRVALLDTPYALVVSPALLLGVFTGWRLIWQLKYNQMSLGSQAF